MRNLALSAGHHLDLYESIHELPAHRHLWLQCYLVQDAGIGSTVEAINQRLARLGQLVSAGAQSEALTELENLHYTFHFALEQFAPEQLAFGCLVAQVDGAPVEDYSEAGLQRLLRQLGAWGLTAGMVEAEVLSVKKNSRRS
jgi:hypothetical protein